jgi:hypothetical protein
MSRPEPWAEPVLHPMRLTTTATNDASLIKRLAGRVIFIIPITCSFYSFDETLLMIFTWQQVHLRDVGEGAFSRT